MAKKFANYQEAKDFVESTKEELKTAKGELKEMKKSMGVKNDDLPENPKDAKKLTRLKELIEGKETAIEEANAFMKENKPKKEKAPRDLKYAYPADCVTADQKKKFRTEARAAAKRAEKAALKGEKADKPKKDKKADKAAPVEETKKSKKDKKAEKKAGKKED